MMAAPNSACAADPIETAQAYWHIARRFCVIGQNISPHMLCKAVRQTLHGVAFYYIILPTQKTIAFFPKSVYNSSMHVVWNVCKGGNE